MQEVGQIVRLFCCYCQRLGEQTSKCRGVSAKADYDQHYALKFVMHGDKVAYEREYFNAEALAKARMLR